MEKILTVQDFQRFKQLEKGFICISDSTKSNKVHNIKCGYISEENFKTKVITNKEKQGSYFWSDNSDELLCNFKGSLCKYCS